MSVKKRAAVVTAILTLLLVLCIGIIAYGKLVTVSGKYAYIYQYNKVIQIIDISNVSKPYQLRIEAPGGGYNLIEVRQGSIGVVEASCPDHLCQSMGFITNSLLPVTCLPNHLVIIIENDAEEPLDLDDIAY